MSSVRPRRAWSRSLGGRRRLAAWRLTGYGWRGRGRHWFGRLARFARFCSFRFCPARPSAVRFVRSPARVSLCGRFRLWGVGGGFKLCGFVGVFPCSLSGGIWTGCFLALPVLARWGRPCVGPPCRLSSIRVQPIPLAVQWATNTRPATNTPPGAARPCRGRPPPGGWLRIRSQGY